MPLGILKGISVYVFRAACAIHARSLLGEPFGWQP